MFDAKTLAARMKEARKDLGLNQKELAALSGVGNSYISEIESRKKVNIGVEVVFALADALKVSPAYLLGLTDYPLAGMPGEVESSLPRPFQRLYDVYEQLGDYEKKNLLNLLDDLVQVYVPRIVS